LEFFSSHEVTLRKYHSSGKTEIFFTRLKLPTEKYFRSKDWRLTDFIIWGLHFFSWMTFLVYAVYVFILRKKSGFNSRRVKDSTMYRPYSFDYEEEDPKSDSLIDNSEE
jgi:hypothetical protein